MNLAQKRTTSTLVSNQYGLDAHFVLLALIALEDLGYTVVSPEEKSKAKMDVTQ